MISNYFTRCGQCDQDPVRLWSCSAWLAYKLSRIGRRECQSLAVWASGPTARPAHATAHLINSNLNTTLSGDFLLRRGDPTYPLVTCQRSNVKPKVSDCGIKLDGTLEICSNLWTVPSASFLVAIFQSLCGSPRQCIALSAMCRDPRKK